MNGEHRMYEVWTSILIRHIIGRKTEKWVRVERGIYLPFPPFTGLFLPVFGMVIKQVSWEHSYFIVNASVPAYNINMDTTRKWNEEAVKYLTWYWTIYGLDPNAIKHAKKWPDRVRRKLEGQKKIYEEREEFLLTERKKDKQDSPVKRISREIVAIQRSFQPKRTQKEDE